MKHTLIKTEDCLLVVDKNEWDGNNVLAETKLLDKNLTIHNFQPNKGDRKILAHLPLNGAPYLDGVDVLPKLLEEVDNLVEEEYFKFDQETRIVYRRQLQESLASMFNKAKETYKYTEEDLRKAIGLAREGNYQKDWVGGVQVTDKYDENEIIQSLNQPKLPVAFQCEMIEIEDDLGPLGHTGYPTFSEIPKTFTNSDGRTEWVGKYLFN